MGGPVHDGNTTAGSSIQPQDGGGAWEETFLQGRGRIVQDPGILNDLYPRIGEGEMSTVHFIVHHRCYCKGGSMKLRNWLVTSVDTDRWMIILLTMGTGKTVAEGPDAVSVTVGRLVRSTVEYLHVNRIFQAIARLTEIGEHAGWPSELPTWLDNGAKAVSVRPGVCLEWVRLPAGHRQMPFSSRVGIAVAVAGNPGIFSEIVSCGSNGHIRVNE